jgi:hypothetical protein
LDGARGQGFIGREAELGRLARAYARATTGESRIVVVAGEAGIGKSRLVATFADRVAGSGVRVLVGGCLPLGTGGLPYGPFVEAFRALFRDVDPGALPALLGPSRGELARLMPEVRGRPDRQDLDPGPPSTDPFDGDGPPSDERFAQVRLFELILGVLERIARLGPVLLVIEDLQWADQSTRDLLSFLVRNLRDERVLLIATIRTDEVDPRRTFLAFLAELERDERVDRIDLARFDRDDLTRLLADELGHIPDAGLVDRTLERTDGNPFYAEQVVAASRETGTDAVPARLRDVVLARVAAVSDAGQEVLRVASVADTAIPAGPLGESIKRGLALVEHTPDSLPSYVGGNLRCTSCHLDRGLRPNAAPLAGVHNRFPKYIDRSGAVVVQAGDEGNLIVWDGGETLLPKIPVRSIDSTGAGDAFAAALAVPSPTRPTQTPGRSGRPPPASARRMSMSTITTSTAPAMASLPNRKARHST